MDIVKSIRTQHGRCYRWIVLFCCYCVMAINLGVFYSQAPLFVTIMYKFDVTRTEASIVPSLMIGLSTGLGGIFGPLMHRFGKRNLMLLGSLLSASGMVASAFATSLTYLIVTSGIITGTGMCPVEIGSAIAVSELFQGKHGAITLSFLHTSKGVGGALLPQLAEYIDDTYGYLGTHMILGGLFLQGIVASMLMFPERTATRKKRHDSIERRDIMANNDKSLGKEKSTVCKSDVTKSEIQPVDNQLHVHDNVYAISDQANVASCHNNAQQVHVKRNTDGKIQDDSETHTKAHCKTTRSNIRLQAVDKKVLTYTKPSVMESLRFLSRQRHFWLYSTGLALVFPTLTILPILIIDLCADVGLSSSEGTLALSLISTSSALGRFLPGLILKIPKMPALGVPIISGTLEAISLCVIATSTTATQIHVFSTTFGLSHGLCLSTFSVITVELFGVNYMANGLGIIYTTSAISGIAFGPIAGYIRDSTQQYSIVLFVAAGMCMLGTAMFIVGEIFRRKADRRSNNKFKTVFVTKL